MVDPCGRRWPGEHAEATGGDDVVMHPGQQDLARGARHEGSLLDFGRLWRRHGIGGQCQAAIGAATLDIAHAGQAGAGVAAGILGAETEAVGGLPGGDQCGADPEAAQLELGVGGGAGEAQPQIAGLDGRAGPAP